MLDFIVLGMVLCDSLTGYDIKKHIEDGIGVFYKASFGSLYPSLKKLTDKGFLAMWESPHGARQKKFYRITSQGEERFFRWLSSPMQVLDGTNTHLAKVYFFDKLSPKLRAQQLLAYETNNIHYLQKLKDLETRFDMEVDQDAYYYKLSTLYYGICATQEAIRWCRHIRLKKPLSMLLRTEEDSNA